MGKEPKIQMLRSRPSARGFAAPLLVALSCSLFSLPACAPDSPDTVASMRGFRLDKATLQTEYERANGEGTWTAATPEARREMAELLAKKELLLRLAKETCPQPDWMRARLNRIAYEKNLQQELVEAQRSRLRIPPEELAEQKRVLLRSARVRLATMQDSAAAAAAWGAVQGGSSFDQIVERYAAFDLRPTVAPGTRAVYDTDVAVTGGLPAALISATLQKDLAVGAISEPVRTKLGFLMCEILEYRPLDLTTDPALETRITDALTTHAYRQRTTQFVDSLRTASGRKVHLQATPTIQAGMRAHWDSLEAETEAGTRVNFRHLPAPTWRFEDAAGRGPAVDLYGKTYSARDFIATLDDVDLDFWPTTGDSQRIRSQIENRLTRLMCELEARKLRVDQRPAFGERQRRAEELGLLDQLRETVIARQQISDADLQEAFAADPGRFVSGDRMAYGKLLYPPTEEARARAVRERLIAGDAKLWYELGPQEAAAVGGTFDPDGEMVDVKDVPTDRVGISAHQSAYPLQPGQISQVFKTPKAWGIVRVSQRGGPVPLTFEQARERLRLELTARRADEEIEKSVQTRWEASQFKLYEERLAD